MEERAPTNEEIFIRPLVSTSNLFRVIVGALLVVVGIGLYSYLIQLSEGLVVTGLRNRVMWGMYITNFVYFIAISMAGTLISAILRLTNSEWRRPITRMAEIITVLALIFAAASITFDIGRPDRLAHLIIYGRLDSPLVWDFAVLATYLAGSLIYLYLPLIPDIAYLRDHMRGVSRFRRWIYDRFSLGWTGSESQKRRLEKGIKIMAITIIPVAVSIHSVTAWIFGMTLQTGWHSTIFAPYFVIGAIFSGIATIILVMAVFRRVYHFEALLTPNIFRNLGYLMLATGLGYVYFLFSEFLTFSFGGGPLETGLLSSLFTGGYSTEFWIFAITALVIPPFLVAIPKTRTILGITIAAVLVSVGMWYARWIIIVPTLAFPFLYEDWAVYTVSPVEISLTALTIGGFVLLIALFSKLFPIVSMWEVREGAEIRSAASPTGPGVLRQAQALRGEPRGDSP